MVLLRRLSGSTAEPETLVRRFPFRVGRGPGNHLRLREPGVWENHFRLEWGAHRSVALRGEAGASTLVNGQPVQATDLRLGDRIEAGAAVFSLWLSPVQQIGLKSREALTWVGLALLAASQVYLALSLTP